ncbi:MAG: hypothetical protein AAFX62_17095, partial [Pseudomonadota bacterium]
LSPDDLTLRPLREPLILRNAEKDDIDYRETRATRRMRREVEAQNEAIMSVELGQGLPVPSRLRRIFNGDFGHGGRFYAEGGGWQTLTKAQRVRLRHNGELVIESDFRALHPTLAYAACGLTLRGDPYDIAGFPRPLVKIAFNLLLNSRGRNGARHGIAGKPEMADHLRGKDFGAVFRAAGGREIARHCPGYATEASREAERLIDALLARHAPIRDLFFTGIGPVLQKRDSDIAEAVMRDMRRHSVVVLPVHDSFICPASKADLLEDVMRERAREVGAACDCSRTSANLPQMFQGVEREWPDICPLPPSPFPSWRASSPRREGPCSTQYHKESN